MKLEKEDNNSLVSAEDLKVRQSNIEKTNEQIDKTIDASKINQLGTIFFTRLKLEDKQNINLVLNLLAKLVDAKVSENEKDGVYYTLAGNSSLLGLFSNKKFVSDYIIYLHTSLKLDRDFEKNLRASGFDTLVSLVMKRSIEDVVNIILNTISNCSLTQLEIPEKLEEINAAIKRLKSFSLSRQNVSARRPDGQKIEYKAVYKDLRTEEEKEADNYAAQLASEERKKQVEALGGEEEYNNRLRALAKDSKIINVISIKDCEIDEIEECQTKDDYDEIRPNISDVLTDIIDIYKAAFDLSITMRKFAGVYIFDDSNSNNAELKVMEVVETSNKGEVKLITKEHNSKVLEWIQHNYDYPIKDGLKVARHNQVPSLENIMVEGYNYYPTFIARYALGFVKKEKYINFDKFLKAVTKDVEDRLYKIYKSEVVVNGTLYKGKDLFRAHNTDRLKLIGAFVNSVIFITGKGAENFNNTQFRCISAYSHTKSIDYYTNFKSYEDGTYKGLSEAAQAHFIRANGSFPTSILDITYLSDKEKFYKEVSWAYKELGVVYGEGDIPNVLDDRDGQGVVIGKTLAGELVKFNLGSNAKFVTSIYAGSRSGKGVTTLSILAAIMASGIGIAYLDCKPDMANCFWDIEERAAKRGRIGNTDHVYSYDVNADKSRYNKYSPMKSLMQACPELRNSNMASALFILKNIQLITLTGQYKQRIGDASPMVWIIDEVNNMINKLNSGYSEFERRAPKENAKDLSETQEYIKSVMTFWRNLQVTAASGVNDIYGQCGYKYVVIGQNPGDMFGDGKPSGKLKAGADIIRILGTAPENMFIYGRGLKGVIGVGSKAFHKDRSPEEINALEANKYFVIRRTAQQNANEGSQDDILFQPFLTLNYDNVLASCWTGGLGQQYGYKPNIKEGDAGYAEMIKDYKTNLNSALGQPVRNDILESTDSGYGVVDEGTGFFGLVKTYFSKYGNEAENRAFNIALKPYKDLTEILTNMQLIGENSLFGYKSIEDFLYDFSPEAMQFTNYAELEVLLEDRANNSNNENDEENDGESSFDFNINYSNEEEAETSENAETGDSLDIAEDVENEAPYSLDNTEDFENKKPYEEPYTVAPASDSLAEVKSNKQSAAKKAPVNPMVSAVYLKKGLEENACVVDDYGVAHCKRCPYVNAIVDALPELDDELSMSSSISFIDRALVRRNIKNRYKLFVKAVKEEVGWPEVYYLEMRADRLVINRTNKMSVYELGEKGYNIYDVMDFYDLLFNQAKRLQTLVVDEEVSARLISECGGEVYEEMFNNILTFQTLYLCNTKITRYNRSITMELALKSEVAKNSVKGKVKDEVLESLFSSGEIKKTPQNVAIANRITRNAKRSNKKPTSGLQKIMKLANMTPFEALTGAVSYAFLSIGRMINKAVKG